MSLRSENNIITINSVTKKSDETGKRNINNNVGLMAINDENFRIVGIIHV